MYTRVCVRKQTQIARHMKGAPSKGTKKKQHCRYESLPSLILKQIRVQGQREAQVCPSYEGHD